MRKIKFVALCIFVSSVVFITSGWTYIGELEEKQGAVHQAAETLRKVGFDEKSEPIMVLSSIWFDAEELKCSVKGMYSQEDAMMLSKVTFCEARGINNKDELAAVMWTILNRYDAGYSQTLKGVILAPNQFAYRESAPTVNDYGVDLYQLAVDVLDRWAAEKLGEEDVGRVLPSDFLWYAGDGQHNYFRNAYRGGQRWGFSYESPYN